MMTPRQWVALALVVMTAVALTIFGQNYRQLKRAAAQNELRGGVLTAASDGAQQGTKIDATQQAYNEGLAAARDEFHRNQQEAQRHDPQIATRAATAVPDRVRDNYRARRLARERLGCAGEQCPKGRAAGDAPQR